MEADKVNINKGETNIDEEFTDVKELL